MPAPPAPRWRGSRVASSRRTATGAGRRGRRQDLRYLLDGAVRVRRANRRAGGTAPAAAAAGAATRATAAAAPQPTPARCQGFARVPPGHGERRRPPPGRCRVRCGPPARCPRSNAPRGWARAPRTGWRRKPPAAPAEAGRWTPHPGGRPPARPRGQRRAATPARRAARSPCEPDAAVQEPEPDEASQTRP